MFLPFWQYLLDYLKVDHQRRQMIRSKNFSFCLEYLKARKILFFLQNIRKAFLYDRVKEKASSIKYFEVFQETFEDKFF